MFYVYVLLSIKDRSLYTGYTPDLKKRYIKHNAGYVKATRSRRPLILLYYEGYLDKDDALKRELYLKGGNGKKTLKIQLYNTLKQHNYKYL